MFITEIPVRGDVDIYLLDREYNILHEVHDHNIVTSLGRDYFARKVGDDPSITSTISHISIGSGEVPFPRVGDIALSAETATAPIISRIYNFNIFTVASLFDMGEGTGVLAEAGLYTDDATRKLLCRIVFPTFVKGPSELLSVQWKLKFG